MSGNPEQRDLRVDAAKENYADLAEVVNGYRSQEIPDEFLKSLEETDPELYEEFLALAEGTPEGIDDLVASIDQMISEYESSDSGVSIPQDLADKPVWTQEEAAPFLTAEGNPPEGYSWANRNTEADNWKLIRDEDYVDADNDGIEDSIDFDNVTVTVPEGEISTEELNPLPDTDGDGTPDYLDAPAGGGDTSTPAVEARPAEPQFNLEAARKNFRENVRNYVDQDANKLGFKMKNMDAATTRASRIHDLVGPEAALFHMDKPEEYRLKAGEKTYEWNSDHKTWIESGKSDPNDRLKIYNGTYVQIEQKTTADAETAAAGEAAPTDEATPEAPATPDESAASEEAAATPEASAAPESEEKPKDRAEASKEFAEGLLAARTQMDELLATYRRTQALDGRDRDHTDKYNRLSAELSQQYSAMKENLAKLDADWAQLKASGAFPEEAGSTEMREARMTELHKDLDTVNTWIETELKTDADPSQSFSRARQRDERLDREWSELKPGLDSVAASVDPNMSVGVEERGARGNNKRLSIVHTDPTTKATRTYDKEIQVFFVQSLPDDTYQRMDDITIKYKGEFFTDIQSAVKKAAEDFKTIVDEVPADRNKDAKEEKKASEQEESGDTVTLRWQARQNVFDDIAALPSFTMNGNDRAPLPEGWGNQIHSEKTGHNYLQFVKDGVVISRVVQLEGKGDWLQIPLINHLEEAKAGDYEGIEDDNPDGPDRGQYSPDRNSPEWEGRYKIGALVLKKVERPQG